MNVGSYVVAAIGIVALVCVLAGLTVLWNDEMRSGHGYQLDETDDPDRSA